MSFEVDEAFVREHCKKHGLPLPMGIKSEDEILQEAVNRSAERKAEGGKRVRASRRKYGNEPGVVDGFRFGSKHEAARYGELSLMLQAGEIRGFVCQYPFVLPAGVKYVSDFVVLNADGTYTVEDAKSEATRVDKTYRLKRRQMRECLGIEIVEV